MVLNELFKKNELIKNKKKSTHVILCWDIFSLTIIGVWLNNMLSNSFLNISYVCTFVYVCCICTLGICIVMVWFS